jgi:hypothetical protein
MIKMAVPIYRPIYKTWLTVYVCLVIGIIAWIMGTLLDLGSVFADSYREFPSGLLLVFVITILAAATVFVGAFTGKTYLALIVASVGSFAAVLILWVIVWILDTWDTTTMFILVIMLAGIVAGMALLFFARWKATIATWFVLSLIFTVAVMRWMETTWGTSLLYWLVVVIIVVLYFFVLLMFVMIPKSFLGVES